MVRRLLPPTDRPASTGAGTTDIALRDIDGDGDGDLVVASEAWTGYVSVFLNTGGGRFGPRIDHVVDGGPDIVLGDPTGIGLEPWPAALPRPRPTLRRSGASLALASSP
jgi:hypothetical protein